MTTRTLSQAGGTVILGLVASLALAGYDRFAAVYRPSGVDAGSLKVLAQRLRNSPEPRAPLSRLRADAISSGAPAGVEVAFYAPTVANLDLDRARTSETVAFISDNFAQITGLATTEGLPLGAPLPAELGVPCWVTPSYVSRLRLASSKLIGRVVTAHSTGRRCTVVGVVSPAVAYWVPNVSLIAPLDRQLDFPGYEVPESEHHLGVNTILKTGGSIDDATLSQVLSQLPDPSGADLSLHLVRPGDYLFSREVRMSARVAAASGALSLALAAMMALVWLVFDSSLRRDTLRTHLVLGATPWAYSVRAVRDRLPTVLYGAAVVGCVNALATQGLGLQTGETDTIARAFGLAAGVAVATLVLSCAFDVVQLRSVRRLAPARETASRRLNRPLFVLHVATPALLLLAIAYLGSYSRLARADLGVRLDDVVAAQIGLRPNVSLGELGNQLPILAQRLRASTPEIRQVAFSAANPVQDSGRTTSVTIEGVGRFLNGEPTHVTPGRQDVTPGYVETLGLRLLAGRDLQWTDVAAAGRVALVNEAAARFYWKDQSPVGRRLKFGRAREPEPWATVIGVVSDVTHEGYRGASKPEIYTCLFQEGSWRSLVTLVRFDGVPKASMVERQLMDSPLLTHALAAIRLRESADSAVSELKRSGYMLLTTTVTALASYTLGMVLCTLIIIRVAKRELAVRIALGSTARELALHELKRHIAFPLVATLLGGVLAYLSAMLVGRLDHDVSLASGGPLLLAALAPLVATLASVAIALPAYRRVDLSVLARADS